MKVALLAIDCQNDFCHPDGALSVPGGDKDIERLAKWIKENGQNIDNVFVTLDTHHVNDIGHPSFFKNKDSRNPNPFTQLTANEVKNGKWIPQFHRNEVIRYLEKLEKEGEFTHTIWPEHCIIGTWGSSLYKPFVDTLIEWSRQGKYYEAVIKGIYPLTEHFGVFRAQIPVANRPETQLNQHLLTKLQEYDIVYLAGQAKSHCVATSLKQILKYASTLKQKIVVFEDCMSPVPGFETLADPIYKEAKNAGIRFATTDKENLRSRSNFKKTTMNV